MPLIWRGSRGCGKTYYINKLSEDLLRYGDITADTEIRIADGWHRIREIRYGDKVYYHHMHNGRLIVLKEI